MAEEAPPRARSRWNGIVLFFCMTYARSSFPGIPPARGVDGTGLYCFLYDICAEQFFPESPPRAE